MRLGRIAIRSIAVLGMLAILCSVAPAASAAVPLPDMLVPAPEVKVTPQAGSTQVKFVVTGVGFVPPQVADFVFLQIVLSDGRYVPFGPVNADGTISDEWIENAYIEPDGQGIVATVLTLPSELPDGVYTARISSLPVQGTVYASDEMQINRAAQSRPEISITPGSGQGGNPDAGGTIFILAGTGLAAGSYTLEAAKTDGSAATNFGGATIRPDADGIIVTTLTFSSGRPAGEYIARLKNASGAVVAETRFTIVPRVVTPIATKPEIKVTPQAGSGAVNFLLTGVGFGPPQVNGRIYFQLVSRATGQYINFGETTELETIETGLIATVLTFGNALPDGKYIAHVASAMTGGTVYASYEITLDSSLPVRPAISMTPNSGPPGHATLGGTLFLLAGSGFPANGSYTLDAVSADGEVELTFGVLIRTDADGLLLGVFYFPYNIPEGQYTAYLRSGTSGEGPVVAETKFGIGPQTPTPPIPNPPPTGTGGKLPGLPNTGAGGAVAVADVDQRLGLAASGLVLISMVVVGSTLRRRRAA
jgi:hypothetical protein